MAAEARRKSRRKRVYLCAEIFDQPTAPARMHRFLFLFLLLVPALLPAQCPPGERSIHLEIDPDQYWTEVTWRLTDLEDNVTYASGTAAGDGAQAYDYCIPANGCAVFRIDDSYGDGMAPDGIYRLYVDNVLVEESIGENYGHGETVAFGCPPGAFCDAPFVLTAGQTTTPGAADTWYLFTPDTTGQYRLSTCGLGNACASKIWVYDVCDAGVVHDNNLGTIFYAENGCAGDPLGASATMYLAAGTPYYIRLGYAAGNCNLAPLTFALEYVGPIVGCTDPSACNYEPLAAVSGPCIYPGDPECTDLPDLIVQEDVLRSSLEPAVLVNADDCPVEEGCLRGYGTRHLLRFTTRIDNIGTADYYIGQVPPTPTTPSTQFIWDACHNHWHYRGYAEYVVFDAAGTRVPLGSKNGFCVLDLTCSPGGSGKYTCTTMGISAGCGDIYDSYLPCQWIDVTGLAAGTYTLAVRVNWDQTPDLTGRPEATYDNNWAQACFTLEYASNGQPLFDFPNDCPVYTDCLGVPYGDAQPDCNGVCNGPAVRGDWDADTLRTATDLGAYLTAALYGNIAATPCSDLFADGMLDVYDAALLQECIVHGDDPAHWGTRFACQFPTGLANPDDIVYLLPGTLDTVAKTFDIEIVNPYSRQLGFEFEISGLQITSVENLDTAFGGDWHFYNGRLLALAPTDEPLGKNILPKAFVRVHYSALTANTVCISGIQGLVNDKYERSNGLVAEPACITVQTSGVTRPEAAFGAYAVPNPAGEHVDIFFSNPGAQACNVSLIDATGRTLRRFDGVRGEAVTIERGGLAAGLYFYRVEGEAGSATGRIFFK
jgi:hypothetical protein